MRAVHVCAVLAAAAAAACVDQTPTNTATNNRLAPSFSAASANATIVFNTELRAENEPGPISTSESFGRAQVMVRPDGTIEFLFTINNRDGGTYTRAHIHKAPVGVNGGIHWDFLEPADPATSISDQPAQLRGLGRPRTGASVADLRANPSGYYVNVHSALFPAGALRGQLQ
jgi:CHRD domain